MEKPSNLVCYLSSRLLLARVAISLLFLALYLRQSPTRPTIVLVVFLYVGANLLFGRKQTRNAAPLT